MLARTAPSAQPHPGKDWHVVARPDGRSAGRASRSGRNDRHTLGNPRDADVQEAANDHAEKKDEGDDHISNVPQDLAPLNQHTRCGVPFLTPLALVARLSGASVPLFGSWAGLNF